MKRSAAVLLSGQVSFPVQVVRRVTVQLVSDPACLQEHSKVVEHVLRYCSRRIRSTVIVLSRHHDAIDEFYEAHPSDREEVFVNEANFTGVDLLIE